MYVLLVRSLTGVSLRKLAGAVTPPVLGSVVAAGAGAFAVRMASSSALALLAGLSVGVGVYIVVLGPWLFRLLRRARTLWGDVDMNSTGAP